jgi:hypothetical protein
VNSFPGELILIPGEGAAKIPCLLLPFPHARFLFLYFHGNAEDLGRCRHFCSSLRDLFHVHVLAVEYPGYGCCPGVPDEESVMANAVAAMTFITETLHWPRDSIKIFGRSIGTGPAVALAAKHLDVAGVILVSPFTSIREVFSKHAGDWASGYVDNIFCNREIVPVLRSPTLVLHGIEDQIVPFDHGTKVYDAIRAKKMMVCPAEMGHNTPLLRCAEHFVIPMTQFFSLPDYSFEELIVPEWCFAAPLKFEADVAEGGDSDTESINEGRKARSSETAAAPQNPPRLPPPLLGSRPKAHSPDIDTSPRSPPRRQVWL